MRHLTPLKRRQDHSPTNHYRTNALVHMLLIYFIELFKHNFLLVNKIRKKQLLTNIALIFISQTLFVNTTAAAITDETLNSHNQRNYLIERINFNLKQLVVDHADDSTQTTKVELSPIENINNIVYHKGNVFVGAQNMLLKLNAQTLQIEQYVSYGPLLDSPACRYNPIEECNDRKYLMNNINKLLMVYEQRAAILSCWTWRQGVCDLRSLEDITRLIQNASIPVVASDPFNTTIGFIASAANSQDLFYVATTNNNFGPYRDEVPALAGRSLSNNRFMQILSSNSQGLKSSKASIEFISRYSKTFIVKYVQAFNVGIYNYFLSVQHMDADTGSSISNDKLVTKLARLCLNDLSFTKSYTEMPLKCVSSSRGSLSSLKSIHYNELLAARLVHIKSENSDSLNYFVIGLFQETSRNTFNASLPQDENEREYANFESNSSIKQAVCMFSLKEIQAKIKENLRKCYDSGTQAADLNIMRGLSFIKPDQRCSTGRSRNLFQQQQQQPPSDSSSSSSSDYSQIGDDFCSSADNGLYPIGGQIPVISNALLEFDSHIDQKLFFDSIDVWSDSIATTLLLKSNKRDELRFYHFQGLNESPVNYRTIDLSKITSNSDKKASTQSIRRSSVSNVQFESSLYNNVNTQPNIFVLTNSNQILKLKMSSCESYKTCGECLLSLDPYCGWCSNSNACTAQSKCLNNDLSQKNSHPTTEANNGSGAQSSKWLNGVQLKLLKNGTVHANLIDSMCVDIESVEPALAYKDSAEWIEIKFRKDIQQLNVKNENNLTTNYQCIFMTAYNEELKTDAVQISATKLKCSLPHASKLQGLFSHEKNKFNYQELIDSTDGIFRISPTNTYYYEKRYDRILLPLYVKSSQTPIIQYGTVASSLANSNTLETLFNITLIDCNAHTSCVSCMTVSQCNWCSNKCLNSKALMDVNIKPESCNKFAGMCESFDTGTNKLLIPYTAHRQQAPLVLSLLNLNNSNLDLNEMKCLFTMFNGKFLDKNVTLPFGMINKTHGHCSLTNVFEYLSGFIDEPAPNFDANNSSLGQVQTNLRLYNSKSDTFIDSTSNGKLALLFYKCEIKANDCSQCLSLNRQFSCMWCNLNPMISSNGAADGGNSPLTQSSCRFMNVQSKLRVASQCILPMSTGFLGVLNNNNSQTAFANFNQCDKPQITDIQPSKLPIGGGTLLTISGVNLGSNKEDVIFVNINCGGQNNNGPMSKNTNNPKVTIKCDLMPLKYVPSKKIVCKTRQSTSGPLNHCRVAVKLKGSQNNAKNSDLNSNENNNGLMNILVTGSQAIEFVDPVISEINPSTVIQSANFVWLTIVGSNLDAGRVRQIQIIDYPNSNTISSENYNEMLQTPDYYQQQQSPQPQQQQRILKCDVKNVTNKELKCRLNEKFRTLGKKDVRIVFDDNMSIMHYMSLRVTSDPLVKSIDKQTTFYTGGTQFRLNGFNFDAVQSAYTYLVYKDLWYSEPLQARSRLSNELILFEFPILPEAFFHLVRQQTALTSSNAILNENYEMQIGFLMDGFNVTLKNMPVLYMPTLTSRSISIKNINIQMKEKTSTSSTIDTQTFTLIIEMKIDDSILSLLNTNQNGMMLRDDLQVFIACSQCASHVWLNDFTFTCDLPSLLLQSNTSMSKSAMCEQKVYNTILNSLNTNSKLNLLHFYLGNYEIAQENDFSALNENLKLYIKTYLINNVDNFAKISESLARATTTKDKTLINNLLLLKQHIYEESSSSYFSTNTNGGSTTQSTNKILLIASVIASFLVILIVFTVILVSIVFKMKRKELDANGTMQNQIITSSLLLNRSNSNKSKKRSLLLLKKFGGSANCGTNGKKSEKQLKLEYESLLKQIDTLELNVRSECSQLFQQLHHDYVNELNHDLIYTLGLPIWNYKTYLFNILFPQSRHSLSNLLAVETNGTSSATVTATSSSSNSTSSSKNKTNNLIMPNVMNASSMSNSTTNSLLSSTLTPTQKQQMNATMSVYATIKSSNMLRFDGMIGDGNNFGANLNLGNVGEAMQLFDQLIHNKTFLLTFIQVCESESNGSFTLKDKCHFASLLTLGLKDNLPYLYSIIKCLLSEYIAKSFQTSNTNTQSNTKASQSTIRRAKLLFRSNESLIEPLLTNWLAMFMYDFQRDTQSATHLYRLVKVIKFFLDMGPCDQETQHAANTLSEEVLLKEPCLFQTVYVNVVNQCAKVVAGGVVQTSNQTNVQICPLLDCDTIQQAKEKIINFLFKTSSKPNYRDVDLELCLILIQNDQKEPQQQTTIITLKETEDELLGANSDHLTLKRLLTLKDYNIQNGSFINLTFKQNHLLLQQQQQQQQLNQQNVYQSMNNEYSLYGSGVCCATNQNLSIGTMRKPLVPMVPPPQLPQQNRFHLENPLNNQKQLLTFSASSSASTASSSSTTSSSSSSPTGGCTLTNNNKTNDLSENQTLNSSNRKRNKASKKTKKYEKLLTVKSQDSAVTTTTTATTIENSSPTASLSHASILTRLLTNKVTLQPFIDQFVETIFTNTANLPPVVQHLFEFFDLEVKKYQNQINIKDTAKNANAINDELNKLTRVWKNNSYFLRYWINLIKNPEFLLSIDPQTSQPLFTTNPATPPPPSSPSPTKNFLVDSSLTCIAQTLLDACSNTETFNLYDTQSPINRLLFIREVPRYKEMIENFYKEMQTYTPITDHELHYYLNEFSKCQQQQQTTQHLGSTLNSSGRTSTTGAALNEINSIQVLLQLYEYYEKYEKQINTLLGQQQCSILLPVHHRLVQIKDLMMSQTCNQTFANHQQTMNRINLQHTLQPHQHQQQQQHHLCASNQYNPYNHQYQQPINCYAATADLNLMNQMHTLSTSNHHQQFTTQKFF